MNSIVSEKATNLQYLAWALKHRGFIPGLSISLFSFVCVCSISITISPCKAMAALHRNAMSLLQNLDILCCSLQVQKSSCVNLSFQVSLSEALPCTVWKDSVIAFSHHRISKYISFIILIYLLRYFSLSKLQEGVFNWPLGMYYIKDARYFCREESLGWKWLYLSIQIYSSYFLVFPPEYIMHRQFILSGVYNTCC